MTTAPPVSRSARPVVTLLGVAAAVAVWVVSHAIAGIELEVNMSDTLETVSLVAVLIASLVSGLAAWLFVIVLERRSGDPRRIWLIVSVVVLLISLAGPLSLATSAGAKGSLAAIHVAVALALIPGLARTLGRR